MVLSKNSLKMNSVRAGKTALRKFGLNLQRWRDPYADIAAVFGDKTVKTVLDGGAYTGNKTSHMLNTFVKSSVYSFEPQKDLFLDLQRKYIHEKRVILVNKALSDESGSADFYLTAEKYTSSLLKPMDSDIEELSKHQIPTTTIDDFSKENGELAFDVLKLDLQGNELKALIGAQEVLRNCSAVLTEVNFRERYDGCSLFHEVSALLHDAGFFLFKIYDIHGYENSSWKLGDALFLKRNEF